jgi:hypothetical protein
VACHIARDKFIELHHSGGHTESVSSPPSLVSKIKVETISVVLFLLSNINVHIFFEELNDDLS